jgi:predicted metal-binding membrane protein
LVAPPRRVLAFFGFSALLFAASAAVTIAWSESMSAMGEMPMPGGWTMSIGAAASFLSLWVVMMMAMMLPSLVPMLWRYEAHLGRLTALVGAGYFFVWALFGIATFPVGVAPAAVEMQLPVLAHAVPIAVGVVVLIAGAFVAAAITIERLAPAGERVARAIGAVAVGAGLFLLLSLP